MKYLIPGLVLICVTASCRKVNNDLPAATHTGRNILACRINGENFVVQGVPGILSTQYTEYYGPDISGADSGFSIKGRNESPYDRQIWLGVGHYRTEINTYVMGLAPSTAGSAWGAWLPWPGTSQLFYQNDAAHSGSITIEYTPKDGILSGTFAFDGYDSGTGETVHITDGRFDIAR